MLPEEKFADLSELHHAWLSLFIWLPEDQMNNGKIQSDSQWFVLICIYLGGLCQTTGLVYIVVLLLCMIGFPTWQKSSCCKLSRGPFEPMHLGLIAYVSFVFFWKSPVLKMLSRLHVSYYRPWNCWAAWRSRVTMTLSRTNLRNGQRRGRLQIKIHWPGTNQPKCQ